MSKPAQKTPVAKAVKAATAPVAPKGEPYVALPKALFEAIMAKLGERPYSEVEDVLAPIRFGHAARELSMVAVKKEKP